MPIRQWLNEGAKWGGGVIGGVLLTWAITSYIERPRPSAQIAQINITNSDRDLPHLARIVSVPLDDSLFRELEQSAWTDSFRDPFDDLGKVVSKLNKNKEYVESYVRHAENYLQLKKDMALFLNGERSAKAAENFFDLWQKIDGFIYGSVRSQMRYGASALRLLGCEEDPPLSHLRKLVYYNDPDAKYFAKIITDIHDVISRLPEVKQPSYSGLEVSPAPPKLDAATNDDKKNEVTEHIYSVTKVGGRYKSRFDIKSNLDENEIITQNEEKCAENIMGALADFSTEKLNAILDLADQEARNIELHKKIRSEIEQHIKGYSFWSVSMLISNKGKDPISFSPNVTLYVDMSGTPIHGGNNLVISLQAATRGGGGGDSDSITIPGGGSRSISFISSDLVRDSEDWKNVITAFEQSSRNCVVVLYPQTGDWQQDKLIFSPVQHFGPPAKADPTEPQDIKSRFTGQQRDGISWFQRFF